MKAHHLVFAAALASVLAVGQARGGRGGGQRGRGSAAAPSIATLDLVQDLYQQAKRAALAAPEVAAPEQMAAIAGDEMRLFPSEGLADFATAFALARALRPPQSGDDAAGQARLAIKAAVELRAIMELARRGPPDQALAFARLADVPRAPLYDQLILAAGRHSMPGVAMLRGGQGAKAGKPADAQETDDVFSLVQECKRSGSYPYSGVGMYVRQPGIGGLERTMLVQDGYQWAGNETDPAEINRSLALLQAGHRVEPGLDGVLAATLTALIQRLAQNPSNSAFASSRAAGGRLMALLTQVDPSRAQALAEQYPAAAGTPAQAQRDASDVVVLSADAMAGAAGRFRIVFAPGAAQDANLAASSNPAGGVFFFKPSPPESSDAAGSEPGESGNASQFRALLAQAESLQRHDPSQALALAGQAAGLLDDALWASQTPAAVALAMLESNLGNRGEADRLLARGLDQADRQAAAADTGFDDAAPAQQALMARGLESAQASVLEVYSLAARLDFTAAAERAEAAQFRLLKPLVLARVALVGEVGQPRAR